VKQIHRVGSNFRKSDWYTIFNDSAHPGIFSLIDQKKHAIRRRLFAQNFSVSSLLRFEPQIRAKVDTAISKIKRDASASRADILKWFTFMATDVIGELSFGVSFDMLKQEEVCLQTFPFNHYVSNWLNRKHNTSGTWKQP
jgi:cytochrome P450